MVKEKKIASPCCPAPCTSSSKRTWSGFQALHQKDLREGFGEVYLPFALARKYPRAGREWAWQYVFPASKRSIDPRSGIERRHHIDEQSLQRMIKKAVRR